MAVLSETITIPVWAVATAVVAIIIVGAAFIARHTAKWQVAAVVGIALLAAFSVAASAFLPSVASQPGQNEAVAANDAAVERRALETRRAALAERATLPGSALACLDALAGEPVETACAQAVFASPLSVAVAVSYAAERLRLLADGIAFARRADARYEAGLADLRLAAENDAYGIYAHVLATRDGCTLERCAAFALLRDTSTLKVHLRQRLYATYVAEHRDRWGAPARLPVAAAVSAIAAAAQLPTMMIAPVSAAPATAPAATTAMAPPIAAAPAQAPPPLPKARPTTVAVRTDAEPVAATPAASVAPAEPPATSEELSAVRPARRNLVPPSASVLPNIDFPSSSSIPAINIMAAEPKLPPAEAAPAAPSTAPRRSSPQQ